MHGIRPFIVLENSQLPEINHVAVSNTSLYEIFAYDHLAIEDHLGVVVSGFVRDDSIR